LANTRYQALAWKRKAGTNLLLDGITGAELPSIVVSEFGDLKVTKIRNRQKWLSEGEITNAAADYQNGMTLRQIAEKYGCHQ